jgi:hypothetical protein
VLHKPVQIHHRVLGAEDVGEAALGQAAVQRHLAALKAAHQAEAGARPWPLWPRVEVLPMPDPMPRPTRLRPVLAFLGARKFDRFFAMISSL